MQNYYCLKLQKKISIFNKFSECEECIKRGKSGFNILNVCTNFNLTLIEEDDK